MYTVKGQGNIQMSQRNSMLSRGKPEALVNLLDGLSKASRAHEFSRVDPALERLLGRPPVPIHQVLSDFIATR